MFNIWNILVDYYSKRSSSYLAGSISPIRLRGMVARPTEKPTNVVTTRGRGSHLRPGGTEVRRLR